MTLKDYLTFIRWKNVMMIALVMLLFKFVLFQRFLLNVSLDLVHFLLLMFSTMFIAIAGYIINDIYDVQSDAINKPDKLFVGKKISRSRAYNQFIAFNSAGLLLGMYLSYYVGHNSYFILYVMSSLLLYFYAKKMKKVLLLGNLSIALVVFLCTILLVVFDVLPVTNNFNEQQQMMAFKWVLLFGVFSFFLTLLREIVKDMEDIKGDKATGVRSLPIVIGQPRTKLILLINTFLVVLSVSYFAYVLWQFDTIAAIYLSIFVTMPMLYFGYDLWTASEARHFHRSSNLLKLIMLFGMLTLLLV